MHQEDDKRAFFETVTVERYQDGQWRQELDDVLVEVPVALTYNGYPHVVIMSTPRDIVDFVYGFSLTEGVINSLQDIRSISIHPKENGIEVNIEITPLSFSRMEGRRRQMSARTGCGICGLDSLSAVVREQERIGFDFKLDEMAIDRALKDSNTLQVMNQRTGGAHAAFFVSRTGEILLTREDVGRHVALDKLVGALLQGDYNCQDGFILTTSRASFEMVQKTVAARVGMLVTMSAPTSMAIKLANRMGLKLAAFTRVGKINLYQG